MQATAGRWRILDLMAGSPSGGRNDALPLPRARHEGQEGNSLVGRSQGQNKPKSAQSFMLASITKTPISAPCGTVSRSCGGMPDSRPAFSSSPAAARSAASSAQRVAQRRRRPEINTPPRCGVRTRRLRSACTVRFSISTRSIRSSIASKLNSQRSPTDTSASRVNGIRFACNSMRRNTTCMHHEDNLRFSCTRCTSSRPTTHWLSCSALNRSRRRSRGWTISAAAPNSIGKSQLGRVLR
jgi:hypothetical protein